MRHNFQLVLIAMVLGLLLPPTGRAEGAFDEAMGRGREQMGRARRQTGRERKHADLLMEIRSSALAALGEAADTEERAQAAALLEAALLKLADTGSYTPRERLTLLLQAAGTHGLRDDMPGMERQIAAAVAKVEVADPMDVLLETLEASDIPALPDGKGGAAAAAPRIGLAEKILAFWDTAVFYVQLRAYEVARVLEAHKQTLHASGAMPVNQALCTFVESAPSGVVAWANSPIVRDPARRAAGFFPMPREHAGLDPSLWDLITDRTLTEAEKAALADPATAFFTVYDPAGWHIYLVTGHGYGEVDIHFSSSLRHIHPYRLRFTIPHGAPTAKGDVPFQVATAQLGDLSCTVVTIPWEGLYRRLPFLDGHREPWGFTITRGAERGSVTWGGREREPGRWGRLAWEPPTAEQRRAIQRRLIGSAWARYQEALPGVTNFWGDPARGEPAFQAAVLQPLTSRYAAIGARLEAIGRWEAAEVEAAFREVPSWMDFARHAAELRRAALLRQFTGVATDPSDRSDKSDSSDAPVPWAGKPVACHVVPAISAVPLTPETRPRPETRGDRIDLVGARGEFVPASFVVDPRQDVARFTLQAGPLRSIDGGGGEISAGMIDLRVVKCWWQPGRSWYSYADDYTRRELMPDLLLHDDGLVKVDTQAREHYVRVDKPGGPEYVWASYHYPRGASKLGGDRFGRMALHRFDYIRDPVADAPVLQPVALAAGAARQFWVTLHVPVDAPGGLYEGAVALAADGAPAGEMRLRLRVLPFELPDPRTAYAIERPFMVSMDGLGTLRGQLDACGGDQQAAERRLRTLYRNQREHNIFNFSGLHILSHHDRPEIVLARIMEDTALRGVLLRQLELIREAGFRPPLIAAAQADISYRVDTKGEEGARHFRENIAASAKYMDMIEQVLGHRDVYYWGSGEPSPAAVTNQFEGFRALKAIGIKIGSEGQPWLIGADAGLVDLVNLGGAFFNRGITAAWHARNGRVLWYAGPHPGAKNPLQSRRVHGMLGYQAHFDGTKNNTWGDSWLDFYSPHGYHIRMIYPTRDGVLDTLQWEGFRAGIDDVRYATRLRLAAATAAKGGDAAQAATAGQALAWLDAVDAGRADPDAMRLEMVNWILRLTGSGGLGATP